MKKNICTIIVLFISMLVTAVAISLFVNIQLGADTLTVLLEGIHVTAGVSLGTASIICNLTLLIIAILLNKKEVKINTVLFTLLIGVVLDKVNPIVTTYYQLGNGMHYRILGLVIAQLLISFGFAILIESKIGMQSMDVIIYYFKDRLQLPYIGVKLMLDGIFLLSGWLLGGTVGIGTIVSLLTTGVLIKVWLKLFSIFYKKKGVEMLDA